jgi:hypothetical protein
LLDYHTFSGYGLGKGILGNDYEHPLAACVTGVESKLPASISSIRVSIVSSEDEYKRAFHIDEKVDASFLDIASLGDEMHFGQENSGSSSAFDIIVEAYGEHDSDTVNHIKWDPPYAAMVASGDPGRVQQVRKACGDRYIETVFNEIRLFAVMHVSKQQSSSLTTFSYNLHDKVAIGMLSASLSLGGDANISSAHKSGAISIDVYSEGFGDIATPTAAALNIATADGLADVASKLSTYLASLHATGQPVKYRLAQLPLLPTGDLSNTQIFARLKDLKSNFMLTNARAGNLNSLLLRSDPRRMVFREPKADKEVKLLLDKLMAYSAAVATAHDGCRKALKLDICENDVRTVGAPPSRSSVELGPATSPFLNSYMFAIDGIPVPPGQSTILFSRSGTTLLDAARTLKPDASNVDVLALVSGGEYLSLLDIPSFIPQQQPIPFLPAGFHRLLGQDLVYPPYWKDKDYEQAGPPIHVLHADAGQPCNIVSSAGLNFVDENCLTSVGRTLRDVALTNVAQSVIKQHSATYDFLIMGFPTTCFPPPGGIAWGSPLANFHLVISSKGNDLAAQVGLFLPLLGSTSLLPLIEQVESHDLATWNQLAQSRLAALVAQGNGPHGPNPCAPHIP